MKNASKIYLATASMVALTASYNQKNLNSFDCSYGGWNYHHFKRKPKKKR